MIQIMWYFIQTYLIVIVSILFLIFAIMIAIKGIRDAKEMSTRYINAFTDEGLIYQRELHNREAQMPDEYSPEAVFGEDKLKFKDYNDEDIDTNFLNGIN